MTLAGGNSGPGARQRRYCKPVNQGSVAVELSTTVLVIVGVLAVALLVLIVVAPWKQVRAEPPLDPDVEAKLLLPATNVADLGDDDDPSRDATYDDLREL